MWCEPCGKEMTKAQWDVHWEVIEEFLRVMIRVMFEEDTDVGRR